MPELKLKLAALEQDKGEEEEEEEEEEEKDSPDLPKAKVARINKSWKKVMQCSSVTELASKMPNKTEFLKKQVYIKKFIIILI